MKLLFRNIGGRKVHVLSNIDVNIDCHVIQLIRDILTTEDLKPLVQSVFIHMLHAAIDILKYIPVKTVKENIPAYSSEEHHQHEL